MEDSKGLPIIISGLLIALAIIFTINSVNVSYVTNDELITSINNDELVTIDFSHEKIHDGLHWKTGYADQSMSINDVIEMLFVTSNSTEWAHFTLVGKTTGGAIVSFYEGTTVTNNGTPTTTYNRNRNSLNASSTLVFHTPTITADGIKIAEKWVGEEDKKSDIGGDSRGASEFILKQNTNYLIRLTAYSSGMRGAIGGDWYEEDFYN